MITRSTATRTLSYRPALAWFAAIGSFWVFVLVMLGAFTTSIGAGMVFLDWPLSNGSLNPEGWLNDLAMFAEHSHRLSAALMSVITFGLFLWVWRVDARPWLRKLAGFAVILVFAQALVGGLRVLLDHWHVETVDTSVGRLFAMVHATLAQIFVCTLLAVALALTKWWIDGTGVPLGRSVRVAGNVACGLLVLQLAIAAVMRHSFAGLAIPSFPHSSPAGDWLPPDWNFRVGIHFAHRVMAVVLTVALAWLVVRAAQTRSRGAQGAAAAILVLLGGQIILGAFAVWTHRNPYVTTGHVLVGALLLAVTFGLTCWSYRPAAAKTPGPLPAPQAVELARR